MRDKYISGSLSIDTIKHYWIPQILRSSSLLGKTARVVSGFYKDKCGYEAGAIAFTGAFSVFPLLLLASSVFGFLLTSDSARIALLAFLSKNAPIATNYLGDNLEHIVDGRRSVGIVSLGLLLINGIAIFGSLETALNRVLDIKSKRGFLGRKAIAIIIVAIAGVLALASILISVFLMSFRELTMNMDGSSDLAPITEFALRFFGSVLSLIIAFVLFIVVYRLVPDRNLGFHNIWPGALLSSVWWELGKMLAAYFIGSFTRYSLIYGSLASGFVFFNWIYLSSVGLLIGAELIKVKTLSLD